LKAKFPHLDPMNAKLITAHVLTLSALAVLLLRAQQGAGLLDPTTDPEDGMYRTLEEVYAAAKAIEPRTAISSVPYVIDQPGSYILVENLEASPAAGSAAIRIESGNVTIDLNGFTLSSTPEAEGKGIEVATAGEVTVRNGFIEGSSSVEFAGGTWAYTPGGFDFGLHGGTNISDLSVRGCRRFGIASAARAIVKECTVSECREGIICPQGTVSSCSVSTGENGIDASGGVAVDCHSYRNEEVGIFAGVISRCVADSNGRKGLDSNVVVASSAKGSEDGVVSRVISQSHASGNSDTGLRGVEPSAVSLSSAASNDTADIDTPGTRTGNYPSP